MLALYRRGGMGAPCGKVAVRLVHFPAAKDQVSRYRRVAVRPPKRIVEPSAGSSEIEAEVRAGGAVPAVDEMFDHAPRWKVQVSESGPLVPFPPNSTT